ncbi:MAG: hypothetical protein OQK82_06375 [Candidatus Pacearchaeota archaeon]|nr:hypothetical protein [Candidatus Pacearchaeota archaeon]
MRDDVRNLSYFEELKYDSVEMDTLFNKFHTLYSDIIIKGKFLGLTEQEKEERIPKLSDSIDKLTQKHGNICESYQKKLDIANFIEMGFN